MCRCDADEMQNLRTSIQNRTTMQRDGVPTDDAFIKEVIRVAGRVELQCRAVYLDVLAPGAPFALDRVATTDAYVWVNGVTGYLHAAMRMHDDDVATLSQLTRNRTIEAKNAKYALYRATFLTQWIATAPYPLPGTDEATRPDRGLTSMKKLHEKCMSLAKEVSTLIMLCNKINTFGYINVTTVLAVRGAEKMAILLDRAMRLYQYMLQASDTAMVHLSFSPILPIPPVPSTTRDSSQTQNPL